MAALRHPHNLSLPVVRDNIGHFKVRVLSQHPSSPLLGGTTWQGHAVKIGGLARAAVESDLGAADTTQGRLRVLRGQFQDPVPGAGAVPPHHNTLTLLGIFILDTTAPHIRKYVTRVLLERAQRHAHHPAAA